MEVPGDPKDPCKNPWKITIVFRSVLGQQKWAKMAPQIIQRSIKQRLRTQIGFKLRFFTHFDTKSRALDPWKHIFYLRKTRFFIKSRVLFQIPVSTKCSKNYTKLYQKPYQTTCSKKHKCWLEKHPKRVPKRLPKSIKIQSGAHLEPPRAPQELPRPPRDPSKTPFSSFFIQIWDNFSHNLQKTKYYCKFIIRFQSQSEGWFIILQRQTRYHNTGLRR